jgi:hypothetical protein
VPGCDLERIATEVQVRWTSQRAYVMCREQHSDLEETKQFGHAMI